MSKQDIMLAELEYRTRDEFEDENSSHADYAVSWLESGGTVLSLAQSIGEARGISVRRAALSRYLSSVDPEWTERSRAARAIGAVVMVEEAHALADRAHLRDDVPGAKLQVDAKLKIASMFNRAEFGGVSETRVMLNIGQLHIDAMRQRSLERAQELDASRKSLESGPLPTDAEVLAIDDAEDVE